MSHLNVRVRVVLRTVRQGRREQPPLFLNTLQEACPYSRTRYGSFSGRVFFYFQMQNETYSLAWFLLAYMTYALIIPCREPGTSTFYRLRIFRVFHAEAHTVILQSAGKRTQNRALSSNDEEWLKYVLRTISAITG